MILYHLITAHMVVCSFLLVVFFLLWYRQDKLLCKRTGVTDANWGLDSMIIGVLAGVTELTTCLQTTGQPIQHPIARIILSTRRALKQNFEQVTGGPDPDYPEVYRKWREAMKNQAVGKDDLVKEMDKLGHIFATKLGDSFDVRFAPYMGYYHAMELIDPTAPASIPDGTWEMVEDICNRYNLSYANVKSEIRRMRDDAVDLSLQEITMCKANLLKFYRDKYLSSSEERRCIHLNSYARVIFQLPFETVLIESLFSIMNYNKDKKRASLNDKSVESVIHTRDIPKVTKNVAAPFAQNNLSIDLQRALDHRLKW